MKPNATKLFPLEKFIAIDPSDIHLSISKAIHNVFKQSVISAIITLGIHYIY